MRTARTASLLIDVPSLNIRTNLVEDAESSRRQPMVDIEVVVLDQVDTELDHMWIFPTMLRF